MKIALVDDDPRALAQLEQYLTEQLGRETEISRYGSGEALLADWRPGAFELVVDGDLFKAEVIMPQAN